MKSELVKSEFVFLFSHQVRWVECDPQWVVFNGHYLTFFDNAISEYGRHLGLPRSVERQSISHEFFARKASIEYFAPARFDDKLEIGVRVSYLGRSSLRFVLAIFRGEELLTACEMTYVYVDIAAGQSEALPQIWRDKVLSFERTPVDQGHAAGQ